MGLATLTFDLETGTRVTSKVWNLPSKFEHARPLGSRIIRYVHDGLTDRRTKSTLIAPFSTGRGVTNIKQIGLGVLNMLAISTRSPASAGIANRPLAAIT